MRRSTRTGRRTQGILGGRSARVVRRVFDAALAEIARSGFAGFRMEEVARRASVNKTTIYRRWPSRATLITALVARMREPLRDSPLPDTGSLERDLVEAFERRAAVGRQVTGRAWARLIEERHLPEVRAIIGQAVDRRAAEWRSMVARGVERGELPKGTDARLVLQLIRAIAECRDTSGPMTSWLTVAVRTVLAGARDGTLIGRPTARAVR